MSRKTARITGARTKGTPAPREGIALKTRRIALSGKMTSGKTTAAEHLVSTYGFVRRSFASPLRELAAIHESTGSSRWHEAVRPIAARAAEFLYEGTGRRGDPEQVADEIARRVLDAFEMFQPTPGQKNRKLLQYLGTEVGRAIHPDIWVHYLLGSMRGDDDAPVVVDDMRFKNEFTHLQRAGFVTVRLEVALETMRRRVRSIYGESADTVDRYRHPSEIDLDDWIDRFDYVIDPEVSVEQLKQALDWIVASGSASRRGEAV